MNFVIGVPLFFQEKEKLSKPEKINKIPSKNLGKATTVSKVSLTTIASLPVGLTDMQELISYLVQRNLNESDEAYKTRLITAATPISDYTKASKEHEEKNKNSGQLLEFIKSKAEGHWSDKDQNALRELCKKLRGSAAEEEIEHINAIIAITHPSKGREQRAKADKKEQAAVLALKQVWALEEEKLQASKKIADELSAKAAKAKASASKQNFIKKELTAKKAETAPQNKVASTATLHKGTVVAPQRRARSNAGKAKAQMPAIQGKVKRKDLAAVTRIYPWFDRVRPQKQRKPTTVAGVLASANIVNVWSKQLPMEQRINLLRLLPKRGLQWRRGDTRATYYKRLRSNKQGYTKEWHILFDRVKSFMQFCTLLDLGNYGELNSEQQRRIRKLAIELKDGGRLPAERVALRHFKFTANPLAGAFARKMTERRANMAREKFFAELAREKAAKRRVYRTIVKNVVSTPDIKKEDAGAKILHAKLAAKRAVKAVAVAKVKAAIARAARENRMRRARSRRSRTLIGRLDAVKQREKNLLVTQQRRAAKRLHARATLRKILAYSLLRQGYFVAALRHNTEATPQPKFLLQAKEPKSPGARRWYQRTKRKTHLPALEVMHLRRLKAERLLKSGNLIIRKRRAKRLTAKAARIAKEKAALAAKLPEPYVTVEEIAALKKAAASRKRARTLRTIANARRDQRRQHRLATRKILTAARTTHWTKTARPSYRTIIEHNKLPARTIQRGLALRARLQRLAKQYRYKFSRSSSQKWGRLRAKRRVQLRLKKGLQMSELEKLRFKNKLAFKN